MMSINSYSTKSVINIDNKQYTYYDITRLKGCEKLPYSLKVLLENLVRNEDNINVNSNQIRSLLEWNPENNPDVEIQFTPARVIMQDFTGVPCVVDLAAMREAIKKLGGNPDSVNPLAPAELVIDHSVISDEFGTKNSFINNVSLEYERNEERYQFLRWGQKAFSNFKVVPPGTGIVHQVNIEYLARVVFEKDGIIYPDTCVGTDSHTTMVNGLGVLGWGVGGIEAEAAMLGQPVSMLIPKVVGFKLTGKIPSGVTATDVVLTITELLRKHGVVGKIVEFYGDGVASVPLANRATIGNMSPEFGSTAAIFPIDNVTVDYLKLTGRTEEQLKIVSEYAKIQGMWHEPDRQATYSEYVELDLNSVVPSIAGPKRPQDRIEVKNAKYQFGKDILKYTTQLDTKTSISSLNGEKYYLKNGDIAIASITSCTNTSNPSVMMAAGILAKKAVEKGLRVKPWVKTTLAPGSKVVTEYYNKSGLTSYLEDLGFYLVGYGCVTCIGNSGPLPEEISKAINENNLAVASVLSGNRNFEGRINPDIKMNYLASPPLVIAYALSGTMNFDFDNEPLGKDSKGNEIFLKDIWPTPEEVQNFIDNYINKDMYLDKYSSVFEGDDRWKLLDTPEGINFDWNKYSTYIRKPPYFENISMEPNKVEDIESANVLVKLGDSVTTDHISPAGSIKHDSPAGKYLLDNKVQVKDYNSYGSRRGNHEVMIRGTFANIRLRNQLLNDTEGGYTRDFSLDGREDYIYNVAQNYILNNIPAIILGGKEYGSGSSRDWAAKGTSLLGVKAVLVESFERIHRSNLIGMGVLPLEYLSGENAESLGLEGTESYTIKGISSLNIGVIPEHVDVYVEPTKFSVREFKSFSFKAKVRIDTPGEAEYYKNGGILQYVLRNLVNK